MTAQVASSCISRDVWLYNDELSPTLIHYVVALNLSSNGTNIKLKKKNKQTICYMQTNYKTSHNFLVYNKAMHTTHVWSISRITEY